MGFFGGLVMIFDDVKSGEMLDFVEFVEVGIEVKVVKMYDVGCMGNVCDVGMEHMTMILKIEIIPKM